MILEGQIEYKIAGIPTFVADQGDIGLRAESRRSIVRTLPEPDHRRDWR
jgi:hypothetical protein